MLIVLENDSSIYGEKWMEIKNPEKI